MRFRDLPARAATATILALLGCGGGSAAPSGTAVAPVVVTRVLPPEQLWVLEVAGLAPEDTTVTFALAEARTIILRHGPPDNTVFVELTFPESVVVARDAPDSVTIAVRPRPGIYGLDVAMTVLPTRTGSAIRFKYPVHFSAPVAGLRQYGTATRFEQGLAVGQLVDGTRYALLASTRPASDNLQAPLPGPGTYLVAAPREVRGTR